ncbi:molybdopterin-guanine dinucleotide biosynthesis protein B [Clostridium niameyense]|uniref:Molybdopterin-guanine dinucleotide biosynthesis protein B n=1 Tax=Clostridium niameyense TaxID=1622073 RepID=A0A6M0R9C8_9CLOT|nr:molybdopterin-guanine dinucleotide biosynthesis protein B [Clostridium niameyense]NEZ46861.1 molybdopterin-guanine dinucleotide biosynthesis protein B [Clostridium niameyense]
MVPVVSVVGKSNVGKTTLIEKLLKELVRRGYNVATIKHDVHGFDVDKEGKDTYRHAKAGASSVTISSPNKIAMIKKVQREWTLDELIELNSDADLVIVEGFKNSSKPKIEVVRSKMYKNVISKKEHLIAIASDISHNVDNIPVYDINDYKGLVDLIEQKILKIGEKISD